MSHSSFYNFAGAPWTAKHLRAKSNEDLHKLWSALFRVLWNVKGVKYTSAFCNFPLVSQVCVVEGKEHAAHIGAGS